MRYLFILAIISCTVVFAGCDASRSGDPVVQVDDDDAAMNTAIETARKTFGLFSANWKTMPNDAASIKVGLPTTDGSLEHIWFTPTEITELEITGVCGNNAANIPDLKLGDSRTFKRSEISDWMILVGDKCYGGYTIRVLTKLEPENAPPLVFVDFESAK